MGALARVHAALLRGLPRPAGLALACLAILAAPSAAIAGPAPSQAIGLGAWLPHSAEHPRLIDRFAREVGRRPVILSLYPSWSRRPFEASVLNPIWNRGAVPLITWEPWSSTEEGIPLREIARGRYDPYIRRSAREAAAWGHPILLRFAHEMNGTWYPWGRRGANTPRLYVRVWRHVVRLFREAGAGNVQWVWAPEVNEEAGPSGALPLLGAGPSHPYPFARYYPGDRWVDWVGLDGFNWGKGGEWQSFTTIFANSYDTVIGLTRRPIIITETASNERGGEKGAWIQSALGQEVPRFRGIRAVVWFNEAFSGVAARLDSSPAALSAFRAAVSSPLYSLSRGELLATPHSLPSGTPAPPGPSGGYGEPSFVERLLPQLRRNLPWSALAILGIASLLGICAALGVRWSRRWRGERA